jgi:CheY-like chemotaxis protein
MPKGGILSIGLSQETVADSSVAESTPGTYVTLKVTDTGVGMDENTLEHLFEPFYTTKEAKGTGLGLSIVYTIVAQSGGSISVQSEPGKGSTFTIRFPLTAQEGARCIDEPGEQSPGGNETILLVEDEEPVRMLLRSLLEKAGYTVRAAKCGVDALRACCSSSRPDLLLTDVIMPGMRGVELSSRIRRLHPATRVIYVTGFDGAPDIPAAAREEKAVLWKPFTSAALLTLVRRTLDAAPAVDDSQFRLWRQAAGEGRRA